MKKTALKFGIFCCLILSVSAAPLFASQEGVGTVVASRGEVTAISENGALRRLSIKSPVHLQDTVRTGPRGRVQILFSDNTIFSLGRDSEMKVAEYEWDPGRKTGAMKTEVKEGAFRVLGGAITKSSPDKFTTETPVATIGIRGSMYAGSFRDGALAVVFQGGTGIYVANPSGTVDIRHPGFGTRVPGRDKAPETPERLSSQELDEVLGELESEETGSETENNEAAGRSDLDGTADEESDRNEAWNDESERQEEPLAYEEAEIDSTVSDDGSLDLDTTVTETLTDSTQTDLSRQIDSDTDSSTDPATDPASPTLTGKYSATLYDIASSTGSSDAFWTGAISGVSTDGLLTGEAVAQDGKTFSVEMTVPAYNPEGVYAGPVLLGEQTRTVNLVGSDRTFTMTDGLSSDLGEFVLFSSYGTFIDGTEYAFEEVGFMGIPSTALPADGMAQFSGYLAGSSESPSEGILVDPISASFWMGANWHSGKVMGAIFDSDSTDPTIEKQGSPVFFFGDIEGTSLVDVRIIGNDYDPGYNDPNYTDPNYTDPNYTETSSGYGPMVITGKGTFGQFYGSQAQGFGLTGQGETYEILDQSTPRDSWSVTGGAIRAAEVSEAMARGQSRWEGFVIGVGEDMQQPDIDRRFFMNETSADFSLLVDRDLGTITGSISASDLNDTARTLDGITVGGAGGSAYLNDDTFIALVTDGGSGIRNGTAAGGLKTHGNFLVTENPENRWGDYLSWGYWEAAYVDPQTGQHIHVHVPASLWVAGERTPAAEVQNLIDANFTGRYLGSAEGVYIDSYGVMQSMKDGTADLSIQFGAGAVEPVTGSLNFLKPTDYDPSTETTTFVEQTIAIGAGGSVDSSGFNAGIIGGTGGVNGAFYGPGASAVGGNFAAELEGEKYLGIFGGHLSVPQ